MSGPSLGAEARQGARPFFRTRAALALVTLVALLSVATGIANIGVTDVQGPLGALVPEWADDAAGFTGALTGFLMLGAAYGLRRRFRVAWYLTVVLLPLTALQGVVQQNVISVPLIVLSVLSLPAVVLNRGVFARELTLSQTQLAALLAVVGVQTYGTVGTYVLREQFTNVQTPTDAFYFTLVTSSTVGYGDITPVPGGGAQSEQAMLFAMSVLLLGVASFAAAGTTLLAPAIQARLERALGNMSDTQLDLLDDHVIVVGVSDLTEPIIEELSEAAASPQFVVVTRSAERAAELRQRDVEVLTADPSDEEPLTQAGIEWARALVTATDDDAQDALSILTARELNPDLTIVAAATERENVKKLKRAGADTVISPAVIGGHLLVQSALGGEGMESVADAVLDVESADDGIEPEES